MSTGSVHEIRVYPNGEDPRAAHIARQVASGFGDEVSLTTADVYLVEFPPDHPAPDEATATLASELFTDPVTQRSEVGPRTDWQKPEVVEVGRQPGVQDPDARAIQHAAGHLGIATAAVATATQYRFAPDTPEQTRENALSILVNPTVDEVHTGPKETLLVGGEAEPEEWPSLSEMNLEELRQLNKDNSWHLSDSYLLTIQKLDRTRREAGEPGVTRTEVEFKAGRLSDHCAHLTFGAIVIDQETGQFKEPLIVRTKETAQPIIEETGNVLSAFHDNAGVMKFYGGFAVAIKKETHNSPSAVEPYGGAGTGTGGVIRDILGTGQGFKLTMADAMYVHASPDYDKSQLPSGVKPPDYLRENVIAGARDYGNQFGVPTAEVHVVTDDGSVAKPTVMVGAIGIAPEQYAYKGEPDVGDLVITIGGRTGRDGLHGATFSSGSMTAETSTKNASSVQIGDPITEKMVADALLELRDAGLIKAITDCGAAGYGSAVGEMGAKTGVTIDLDKIPTKYPGLKDWEKLMSESQERMVLAVADNPEVLERMAAILAKHGVEWAQIGVFDGSHHFTALHQGERVAHLSYEFLDNAFPIEPRVSGWQPPELAEREPVIGDMAATIKRVLAHPNVHYTGDVLAQYDTTVQGNTVLPLFGGVHHDMPNDAVVITPLRDVAADKHYGLVRSHAAHPPIMDIDPYHGAISTYIEALTKLVAVGGSLENVDIDGDTGTAVVAMNNYVWPTPDTPQKFGSLDRAVDGVNHAQEKSRVPIISGKDSVTSTFVAPDGTVIDIKPVLDITVVGAIPDVRQTITADLKRAGSTLVMVGTPDYEGMGGSILHDVADGESPRVPHIDVDRSMGTLRGAHNAIKSGKVLSSKAIGRGGLMAAVTQMGIGGDMGASLRFDNDTGLDKQLFHETPGCLVIEVESPEAAAELFADVPHMVIGTTTADKTVQIDYGETTAVRESLDKLKAVWKGQAN